MNQALPEGRQVHVWFADLGEAAADDVDIVDDRERARADRFRLDRDRRRFIARRAHRRRVLASYLELDPREITFDLGELQKPRVAGVHFSASSSHDLAVVAVGSAQGLGIDIELVTPDHDLALLMAALTAMETEGVQAVAPAERHEAVLRIWTRKEAIAKAIGSGLGVTPSGFSSFEVSEDIVADPRATHDRLWRVQSIDATDGFVGAVAMAGSAPVNVAVL